MCVALTEKQKLLCREYLIDQDGVQAGIRAGYAAKGLDKRIQKIMASHEVQSYMQELLGNTNGKKIADATEIMEYLSSVLRGRGGINDGESVGKAGAKAPDVKEKLRAAELLGKRYALFKEQVEATETGAVPVIIAEDLGKTDE